MHLDVHVEAGVEQAKIDIRLLQHEQLLALRVSPKAKERDHPLRRDLLSPHHPAQRPHQKVRVEVLLGEVLARPAVAPRAERIDDRPQRAPRLGKLILEASTPAYGALV